MIRKKRALKLIVIFTLLLCTDSKKRKKSLTPSKRYLRNGTGDSFQNGGHQSLGDMVLDESLVHVGHSPYKSFGAPSTDDNLQHEIDHLAGNDRDQPVLGIGLQQHGFHRTKFSGGGIDYNEFSQPNEMMMHSNGQQDFYSDKVHMNDGGHLTTNDEMLGGRGTRNHGLYAHQRDTDTGAGKFDAISQNLDDRIATVKQLLRYHQPMNPIGINARERGIGNGLLLLQAQQKSARIHTNDTIHPPIDGSDGMFNMHSSPRRADDHEYIPFPSTDAHEITSPKATNENYDSMQPPEGGCGDRERQRRNCPNLIRIDKKIVRLPVTSASISGHHTVRAHRYNNSDNAEDEDTEANARHGSAIEGGRGMLAYTQLPKKIHHGFGSEPGNEDSWLKDDDIQANAGNRGKDDADERLNGRDDDDDGKTHEEHHIKHGDDGAHEEHHLKHKTGKSGEDFEEEHRHAKGDPENGELHSHYQRHRFQDEPKEREKDEDKDVEEKKKPEPEPEPPPKKKKRKSRKKRIHHMVFSEDEKNPFHDHTKDIVELSGEEDDPDEDEKSLKLDKSGRIEKEKPSKLKKLFDDDDAKENSKGRKTKAENTDGGNESPKGVHQSSDEGMAEKEPESSKSADPEKLLKVAKQIADMEEKIKRISKLPLMEPYKPNEDESKLNDKDSNPDNSRKEEEKIPEVNGPSKANRVKANSNAPNPISATSTSTTPSTPQAASGLSPSQTAASPSLQAAALVPSNQATAGVPSIQADAGSLSSQTPSGGAKPQVATEFLAPQAVSPSLSSKAVNDIQAPKEAARVSEPQADIGMPPDGNVHQNSGEVLGNPQTPVIANKTPPLPEEPKSPSEYSSNYIAVDDAMKEKSAKQFLNVLQEGLRMLRNKTQPPNYAISTPGKILSVLEDGLKIIRNKSTTTPPPKLFRTAETDAVIFVKAPHENKDGSIKVRDDNDVKPEAASSFTNPLTSPTRSSSMIKEEENEALNELETLINDAQKGRDPWTHCPECPKIRSLISRYETDINRFMFLDRKYPGQVGIDTLDKAKLDIRGKTDQGNSTSEKEILDKERQGNASLNDLESLIKDSENTKTALVNCSRWKSTVNKTSSEHKPRKKGVKYDLEFTKVNKRFNLVAEKNHTVTVGEILQNIETLNDLDSLMKDSDKVQEFICKNTRKKSDEEKSITKHHKKKFEYVFSQVGRKRHFKGNIKDSNWKRKG